MGVNLAKGQKVSLDKNMTLARIDLGWNVNSSYSNGPDFDLDAAAFLLGANGKVRNDLDFIFYGHLQSSDGSVTHMGDERQSGGDGEEMIIDFSKIPPDIQKIAITITIYDADKYGQNFGQLSNAYVRVLRIASKDDVGTEVLKFNLAEEFSIETALVICEIYRNNGEWKFNAVGSGYQGGLAALCRSFGVNV